MFPKSIIFKLLIYQKTCFISILAPYSLVNQIDVTIIHHEEISQYVYSNTQLQR